MYIVSAFLILSIQLIAQPLDCEQVRGWNYNDSFRQQLPAAVKAVDKKIIVALQVFESQHYGLKYLNPKSVKYLKFIELQSPSQSFQSSFKWKLFKLFNRRKLSQIKTPTFGQAVRELKDLQETHPDIFKSLPDYAKLSDWDLFVIDHVGQLPEHSKVSQELQRQIENAELNIMTPLKFNNSPNVSPQEIELLLKDFETRVIDDYKKRISTFMELCPDIEQTQCYASPLSASVGQITSLLESYTKFNTQEAPVLPIVPIVNTPPVIAVPTPQLNRFVISAPIYETSNNPKANICKRDTAMLNSITFHHTATSPTDSPQRINELHLDRSTRGDPWFMIGYHYLINDGFVQGREIEYKGAHSGGDDLVKLRTSTFLNRRIECFSKSGRLYKSYPLLDDVKRNKLSGNYTSVGIAVIGSYERLYKRVNGVLIDISPRGVRSTVEESKIEQMAQISCNLQKRFPNIRTLHPHSYFSKTECPGAIRRRLRDVAKRSEELGCKFNVRISQ